MPRFIGGKKDLNRRVGGKINGASMPCACAVAFRFRRISLAILQSLIKLGFWYCAAKNGGLQKERIKPTGPLNSLSSFLI